MTALVIGLITGVLVGASSVGSGSLLTPALLLFTSAPAGAAVGTSLALASGTKLVGYLAHRRMGQVDHRLGLWLIAGALPGALLAAIVLRALHQVAVPRWVTGAVLILWSVAAARTLWSGSARTLWSGSLPLSRVRSYAPGEAPKWKFILTGAVIAFAVTLTSIGSGGLAITALLCWRPNVPVYRLVGTSLFYGLIATLLGASAHLALSNIDARLLAQLAAGTLPGVLLGARLSRAIPERYAHAGIAGLNLLFGLRLALAG